MIRTLKKTPKNHIIIILKDVFFKIMEKSKELLINIIKLQIRTPNVVLHTIIEHFCIKINFITFKMHYKIIIKPYKQIQDIHLLIIIEDIFMKIKKIKNKKHYKTIIKLYYLIMNSRKLIITEHISIKINSRT